MSLSPGARLGPYEITGALGAGGMGEVYRAIDTNLGRQVAIKVLPETVAADAERLARFDREARTLASLNHPNIAAIYGLERAEAGTALVMELVEGPTLADLLGHGAPETKAARALGVDAALPIARQICDALEAAHGQGIVHRDLKPANIKVRPDGTVKVLDFGLAKPAAASGGPEGPPYSSPLSMSPTITTPAMTAAGMILGTAAYMAPEQAKGRPADKRSDIFSFGVVLYEMLAGRRAFEGDDVSDTIASVLRSEPDWSALPADLPPAIGIYLKRCLQKDPAQRIRDIGDVRLALDGAFDSAVATAPAGEATSTPARRSVFWAAAVVAAAAVTGALGWLLRPVPGPDREVARFSVPLAGGTVLPDELRPLTGLALSPDERTLVYSAFVDGMPRLYTRAIDALDATPIPGAEGGVQPVFSPDGRWLAYFDNNDSTLKKLEVSGGVPITLCRVMQQPRFSAWLPDGRLVFSGRTLPLQVVSDAGGTPESLLPLDDGEIEHSTPAAIPGRAAVVFQSGPRDVLTAYDLDTKARHELVPGMDPHVLPDGRLVFLRDGSLWIAPFDLTQLAVTGEARPVVTRPSAERGIVQAAVGARGTLAYLVGSSLDFGTQSYELAWVDQQGTDETVPIPARYYNYPRVSPDGTRVAVAVVDERRNENDLWVYDIRTGAGIRLRHEGNNASPVWTADGQRLVFSSTAHTSRPAGYIGTWWGNLYEIRADGSREAQRLTTSDESQALTGISPDGRELFYTRLVSNAEWQVVRADASRGGETTVLTTGPFHHGSAELSPDGRLIAYRSDESGSFEVYVQSYPELDAKIAVSVGGGLAPVWSARGDTLYYWQGSRVMAVDVTRSPALRASAPRELFTANRYRSGGSGARQYHVGPDGRFVMSRAPTLALQSSAGDPFVVVLNWDAELAARDRSN